MMDDNFLDDLPRISASDNLRSRMQADAQTALANRQRKGRNFTIVSSLALAASLMVGVWIGNSDTLGLLNADAGIDDYAILAEDANLYSAGLVELGG